VISTSREQGKRSKEESLTMEQKMTMVIRAVRNPCTYYIMARSHKRRLGEGTGAGVEVEATSLLSQTVMM